MIKAHRRVRVVLSGDDRYVRSHRYMSGRKIKVFHLDWWEGSANVMLSGTFEPPVYDSKYDNQCKMPAPVRGLPKPVRDALKEAFK